MNGFALKPGFQMSGKPKRVWDFTTSFPTVPDFDDLYMSKAWFSYVGKIPDGRGFYCFPTIPDFTD